MAEQSYALYERKSRKFYGVFGGMYEGEIVHSLENNTYGVPLDCVPVSPQRAKKLDDKQELLKLRGCSRGRMRRSLVRLLRRCLGSKETSKSLETLPLVFQW